MGKTKNSRQKVYVEFAGGGILDFICRLPDGEVMGLGQLTLLEPRARIVKLYSWPEYRKQGVGKAILKEMLRWCIKHKTECETWVKPFGKQGMNKQQLVDWYMSNGFKPYRKSGYKGTWLRHAAAGK